MEQLSLFENDLLKIDKPIRLIELFAGYGSQALALKYLGADFESWRICEWAVKSIIAYKDLHAGDDDRDYSAGMTEAEVKSELLRLGVSNDYCSPMTEAQMKRMPEARARQVYDAIKATRNLVDVCKVHPGDLDMRDGDGYCYVMTYSFPCQDLTTAGERKGMAKGSGTRSGLLWEVERILTEAQESGSHMPDILLMENVEPIVHSNNVEDFKRWIKRLGELGYGSDYQVCNAKNYGVPQNRSRVLMVSNRGGKYYRFEAGRKTERRIRDIEDVAAASGKYDVSLSTVKSMERKKAKLIKEGKGQLAWGPQTRDEIARCILTAQKHGRGQYVVEPLEEKTIMQGEKKIEISGKKIFVNGVMARIRVLTPLECFRLMGVRDEDYYKIEKNQSRASLVHLAGDSIVVNVLMSVFGRMLGDGKKCRLEETT